MEFKTARLDRTAFFVTTFVTALLAALAIFFIIKVPYGWVFTLLMIAIIAGCYLWSPARYRFDGARLVIEKVVGTRLEIDLSEIESYVLIPDITRLKLARTFGNGGLFGYYGIFSTIEYGEINFQLKTLKDVIILKTKKGCFAVSPFEVQRFEEYLKTAVTGITGKLEIIEPMRPEGVKYASPVILVIPAIIFILTIIMRIILYPGLPERIAIHYDFHGNANGWGSRDAFLSIDLIPAAILFVINIIVFYIVRRSTRKQILPNFMVVVVAFVQLFTAYVSLDTYWFNKYDHHITPLPYSILGFFIITAALLYVYYRKVRVP